MDYNATTKIRLFFRYSWLIADQVAADAIYPGLPNNLSTSASSGFAAGMDWIVSTRMVNELRVGKQHAESATTTPNRLPGIMILSGGLFTDPLNPAFASKATAPVTSVTDNISRIHGSHTFKAGFTWDQTLRSSSSDNGIYPNVTVSRNFGSAPPLTIGPSGALISAGARTNFESLFDVLLGRISNTDQTFYSNLAQYQDPGTPVLRNFRYQDYGFFIQDDWRVNRKLMLNVGLRYELFGPPTEDSKQMGILDQAGLVDGVHQLANLTIKQSNQWYPTDRNNFAPRFGFAYDPFGSGKTAIRGAFGIFFDRTIDNTAMAVDAATPGFVASTSVRPNQTGTTDVRLSDGVTLPAPPALANMPADTRSIASIQVINPNLRSAYVEEFNLSVQRQFAKIFVFEAAYVGSRGTKLFQVRDLNQPKIFGDFFQAFSELQAFQAKGTPVSPNNTLVRIFSTPAAAITSLGATNVQQGAIGTAATTLDNTFYTRYAAAGVSDFYIRNYPQFQSLRFGTNDGRSYYNSGQISLRVNSSKLKGAINYTHSKSIDTVSNDTNTNQIDSFNNRLNRGISDQSEPNVVTATAVYRLPLGKGEWLFHNVPRWANTIVGGWDLGTVFEGRSGYPMSITSGIRTTVTGSLINFNGDPYSTGGIDKRGDGVYFYTPGQIANFSLPGLGDYGNSGRNAFKGPPFTNQDASLAKQFKFTERIGLTLRAEFSNVWNHANFSALTGTSYQNLATFGRVGFSRNGRSTMLFARIDF